MSIVGNRSAVGQLEKQTRGPGGIVRANHDGSGTVVTDDGHGVAEQNAADRRRELKRQGLPPPRRVLRSPRRPRYEMSGTRRHAAHGSKPARNGHSAQMPG